MSSESPGRVVTPEQMPPQDHEQTQLEELVDRIYDLVNYEVGSAQRWGVSPEAPDEGGELAGIELPASTEGTAYVTLFINGHIVASEWSGHVNPADPQYTPAENLDAAVQAITRNLNADADAVYNNNNPDHLAKITEYLSQATDLAAQTIAQRKLQEEEDRRAAEEAERKAREAREEAERQQAAAREASLGIAIRNLGELATMIREHYNAAEQRLNPVGKQEEVKAPVIETPTAFTLAFLGPDNIADLEAQGGSVFAVFPDKNRDATSRPEDDTAAADDGEGTN